MHLRKRVPDPPRRGLALAGDPFHRHGLDIMHFREPSQPFRQAGHKAVNPMQM